jgi:hypothetical protein
MSNLSAISCQERVTFDEMIMTPALCQPNMLSCVYMLEGGCPEYQ